MSRIWLGTPNVLTGVACGQQTPFPSTYHATHFFWKKNEKTVFVGNIYWKWISECFQTECGQFFWGEMIVGFFEIYVYYIYIYIENESVTAF